MYLVKFIFDFYIIIIKISINLTEETKKKKFYSRALKPNQCYAINHLNDLPCFKISIELLKF